jgi:hypothetical protein
MSSINYEEPEETKMIRLDLTAQECRWLHMMCSYIHMGDETHDRDAKIMGISKEQSTELHRKIYYRRMGFTDITEQEAKDLVWQISERMRIKKELEAELKAESQELNESRIERV